MSMIEKAARAIADADGEAFEDYPHRYRAMACAVIEALMEPTAEMLQAVVPLPVHLIQERNDPEYTVAMEAAAVVDRAVLRQKWQDLLSAALNEGEGA